MLNQPVPVARMLRATWWLAAAVSLAVCTLAIADQKILYEKKSPYTTIVVTEDDTGLRTLYFEKNGVRQSVVKVGDPDHIELPYARSMMAALALSEQRERVLIVGLGGGTIPMFLHKHYPKMVIDVVDIDPDVVAVAKQFFGFQEDQTLRAHVADGRKFIEQCHQPYDIIFLDAFGSENIPYHLATKEFLQAVRKAVKPTGVVAGNVWSRAANPLYDSMVRTYQEVFDDLYILDVEYAGNKILLALPRQQRITRAQLAEKAEAISREGRFRFDLGELVTYGYQHARTKNQAGRVLLDRDNPNSKQ